MFVSLATGGEGGVVVPPTSISGGGGEEGAPHSGGSGVAGGSSPGEDELGRFWELLDADTQPIMPVPGCAESLQIFNQHKEVRMCCYASTIL